MKVRRTVLSILVLAALSASAVSTARRQAAARPASAGLAQGKKPIEIVKERDWEAEGRSESPGEYATLRELAEGARAILHGRIVSERSFWDESGHPIEHGENITTEYAVEVLRVLKEETGEIKAGPGEPSPPPVATPLTLSRNGGVVYANGHRASVRVKEYDDLAPGREYLFFLHWSPAYKTYTLAGGASGAVAVNEDRSLKPLARSKEIQEELRGVDFEELLARLSPGRR